MDQVSTILGDLGFSPGDDVIDSDLLGEIEYVIGAVRLPPAKSKPSAQMAQMAPSKDARNVALPKKSLSQMIQTTQTTQVAPSKDARNVALPKKLSSQTTQTTQMAPSKESSSVALPKKLSSQTVPSSSQMASSSNDASRAAKIAASNKRITAAQAKLRTAVQSTLDKANKLKARASRLSAKRVSARAGARLVKMSDQLTRAGMQLKKLADNKQLTKTVQRAVAKPGAKPPTGAKTSPTGAKTSPTGAKLAALSRKSLLGAILDEIFGEDAYDPYTSERDPQTIAEAEAYVKAAKESYDAAKQEEVAAANEVKQIRESPEAGTGDNPAYDEAISTGMDAALARGDAGAMLAAGNELLAYLKDQKPSGGSGETVPGGGETVPGGGGSGAGGGGGGGGGGGETPPGSGSGETPPGSGGGGEIPPGGEEAPPSGGEIPPGGSGEIPPGGSGEMPPGGGEMPPPGTEEWPTEDAGYGPPPPHGYPYEGQPMVDPYGGFADPFAGVPANIDRAARGGGGAGGGWDDFSDSGYDPDTDVEAAERAQTAVTEGATKSADQQEPLPDALPSFESTSDEATVEEEPGVSEEEVTDVSVDQGVVGSYLTGTNVLVGCVF